jgi:hypothetical protein
MSRRTADLRPGRRGPFGPARRRAGWLGWQLGLVRQRCAMEVEVYRDSLGNRRRRYWHPKGDYYFRGVGRLTLEQRAGIADTWKEEVYGKLPKER